MKTLSGLLLALFLVASPSYAQAASQCDTPKLTGTFTLTTATYDFVVCVPKDITPTKISILSGGSLSKDILNPTPLSTTPSTSGELAYLVSFTPPTTATSTMTITTVYTFVPVGGQATVSSQSSSFILSRPVPTNHPR